MYKCECGREFGNTQSLNSHKGHCVIHLGEKRYSKNLNSYNSNLIRAKLARRTKNDESSEFKLNKWLSEKHRCEQCNKVMTIYYGSGRFCSRSCSNRWVAIHQSDEAKRRKIEKGRNNLIHDGSVGFCSHEYIYSEKNKRRLSEYWTEERRAEMSRKLIRYYASNPEVPSYETRRKISEKIKMAIESGRRPGYLSLERCESYPEKYWSKVLDTAGISYQREFKILKSDLSKHERGCYFLDFLLPGNVDLEIDGSQHYGNKQKLHDEKRTRMLENAGYHVYRIRWRSPIAHPDIVKRDISGFLNWYTSIINV